MIQKNSIVLYKNQPAVVADIEQDKFIIRFFAFPLTKENIEKTGTKGFDIQEQKVREKDIIPLSKNKTLEKYTLEEIVKYSDSGIDEKIKEAWQLLSGDEESICSPIDFFDLAELIETDFSDKKAWHIYHSLCLSLEFQNVQAKESKDRILFIIK